jgi:hypothetical protein
MCVYMTVCKYVCVYYVYMCVGTYEHVYMCLLTLGKKIKNFQKI